MSRRKTEDFWKTGLMSLTNLYQSHIKVRAIGVDSNFCSVFNICSDQKGCVPLRKF